MRIKYPIYKIIFTDDFIRISISIDNNNCNLFRCYFFKTYKRLYANFNEVINGAIEIQKDNWEFKQLDRISSVMRLTALKGKYDIKNSGKTISK